MRCLFRRGCFLLGLSFLTLHCAQDNVRELQRADLVFTRAKEALARRDHLATRTLLRELLTLEASLGRKAREAEAALLLASNYSDGAEFDSAFALCETASKLYQETADKNGLRAAVLARAQIHRVCGEDEKAYEVLSEELRIEKALGMSEGERELRRALIPIARSMRHADAERRLLDEALAEAQSSHDTLALAQIRHEFGWYSMQQENFDSALGEFLASRSLAEKARDSLLAIRNMMMCGIITDKKGNQRGAFEYFSEALRQTDRTYGAARLREEMLLRVGNIYMRQRRFVGAVKFLNFALRSAIKTESRLFEAYALLQLGHCFSGTQDQEALQCFEAGAALLSHIGLPRSNVYAQSCLGTFALRESRYSDALAYFRNAAACEDSSLSTIDEFSVIADCERALMQSPYDALLDLSLKFGKADDALLYAERRNRLETFRVFSAMEISTKNSALNSALREFSRDRRNYVGAERRLEEVFTRRSESITLAANVRRSLTLHSARLNDVGDSIAAFNPQFRSALQLTRPTLADIQRIIPMNAAVIFYIPTQHTLYALVVTRDNVTARLVAVDRSDLMVMMTDFIAALRQRSQDIEPGNSDQLERSTRELSSRLHSIFIRPIEQDAKSMSRLYVVLPPHLPLIPIHSLKPSGKNTQHVIEQWEMSYLSDASQLGLPKLKGTTPRAVCAFGNAGRTVIDVQYELENLKTVAKDVQIFAGKDASRENLKRLSGDALHTVFDLHFNAERANNSFLVLLEGKGYATESYVKFGELFSLSPFTTASISDVSNAPVHPCVPRTFRMNGASDVVMTMYLPMRKAKRLFNELFYTRRMNSVSAERAYREALLEMMKDREFEPPHVWSAFSLW